MTEHEKNLTMQSIQSYRKIISHLQAKIEELESKMQDKCCFEKKVVYRFKIKGG